MMNEDGMSYTHTNTDIHMDKTDSITLTIDAGGKNTNNLMFWKKIILPNSFSVF